MQAVTTLMMNRRIVRASALAVGLVVAGCGNDVVSTSQATGSGDAPQVTEAVQVDDTLQSADAPETDDAPQATEATEAAPPDVSPSDAADANEPLLQTSDDARDIEVLSVVDGSISSIRSAVDGDRPVLLWFWAPH
jgi:hypothetical protein